MATYFTEDINFNGHVNTKSISKPASKDAMHIHRARTQCTYTGRSTKSPGSRCLQSANKNFRF